MIKNIVFDLGNVLINDHVEDSLKKLINDKNDLRIIEQTFFKEWDDVDKGKIAIQDMFDYCNLPLELKNKYGEILVNYYKYREFNEDLLNLIKKLKKNGYKIFLLTDNNEEAVFYWMSLPDFSFVDGYVISATYGTTKTEKKLFELFFLKYNLQPNECFFIDDKAENIAIGISYGMIGHVFNYKQDGINKLLENLKKSDIKID